MRRDEVVRQLRQLHGLRRDVQQLEMELENKQAQLNILEDALAVLTEQEREIIDKMVLRPVPYASNVICEMFGIEVAAVYRRRNKALQKLGNSLLELR